MNRLDPSELVAFSRRFRFVGGRLRSVKTRYQGESLTVEVVLVVRTALRNLSDEVKPVRLRFRLVGVEEFRFQKRPTIPGGRVTDARLGYFQGQFFVNFDAFALEPGESPKVHDFRASDAYVAGQQLWWEEVEKRTEE